MQVLIIVLIALMGVVMLFNSPENIVFYWVDKIAGVACLYYSYFLTCCMSTAEYDDHN